MGGVFMKVRDGKRTKEYLNGVRLGFMNMYEFSFCAQHVLEGFVDRYEQYRRTGRTYRMLREAVKSAEGGNTVGVVIHAYSFLPYCANILEGLGVILPRWARRSFRVFDCVKSGGSITFISSASNGVHSVDVWQMLNGGLDRTEVFQDHYVWEEKAKARRRRSK